jgi:uncharacterized protein
MAELEYVSLGSTGRKVSRLGFGGAPVGLKDYVTRYDPTDKQDRDTAVNAIRLAVDLGITYFDTAAGYGDGTSEDIFREGLGDAAGIFLATKCIPTDASGVRRSVEDSLRRLGRESLDLLQVHGSAHQPVDVDRVLAPGRMADEMEKLRDEGLVKHLGFTGEAQDQSFYRLLDSGRFEVMQVCYNLIFQHPYDPYWNSGSMVQAESADMGIVAMRGLTAGLFQRWFRAAAPGVEIDFPTALLQFQLSNPVLDVALVGMRTPTEVEKNVAVAKNLEGRIDLRAVHEHYPI